MAEADAVGKATCSAVAIKGEPGLVSSGRHWQMRARLSLYKNASEKL